MRRALIVGYGSIGQRHAEILVADGFHVELVSSRQVEGFQCFRSLADALRSGPYDIVVVANPASSHIATVSELEAEGFCGYVMVEKPLAASPLATPTPTHHAKIRVGYNLRFHPIISRIQQVIEGRPVYSVSAYVGQYLPDWRPGRDYRQAVSANAALGGGAIRELSHELDLVQLLAGDWLRVVATGGHVSSLEIDTDDQFALILECARCPLVQVNVNFLDQLGARNLRVLCEGLTVHADLLAGSLRMAGDLTGEEVHQVVDRNHTYRAQFKDILSGGRKSCTWGEAAEVISLIEAAEQSSMRMQWVSK